jgi:hypothetical protein
MAAQICFLQLITAWTGDLKRPHVSVPLLHTSLGGMNSPTAAIQTHGEKQIALLIRRVIEKFQDCSYFSFSVLDVATLY